MISDTHPEAEAVQIELLRRATNRERFERMCSLTQLALFHARRAIERANPEASARERDIIFLETHYGSELAAAVREYLEQRDA